MTRVRISGLILLVLVAAGVFSGIWTDRSCTKLMSEAEDIYTALQSGEQEKAADKAAALCRDWDVFRKKAAVLVNYNKLLETDRIAAHFTDISSEEDIQPLLSEFIHMVYMIRRNELPYLSSVL